MTLLRFTTEMSSMAYQEVYTLVNLHENLRYSSSVKKRDMPIAVRNNQDKMVDALIDTGGILEEQIINWISSAVIQSRMVGDALYMDSLMHGKLSQLGVIKPSIERAQQTVSLKDSFDDYDYDYDSY